MGERKLWRSVLGVEGMVIEKVTYDETTEAVFARVRPRAHEQGRCSYCRHRCSSYDRGGGRRTWRCLDLGTTMVFLEADAPRVRCPVHGVVVASVPWARRGARFTRRFEDQLAWLVTHTDRTTVAELMRISWRTVGRVVERVADEAQSQRDLLNGLRRIGIDEISHRKGHRYLVVVVDHDSGRLVWASEDRTTATVRSFFEALGPKRCAQIEVVSADGAGWISGPVRDACPDAVLCLDPFHVAQWGSQALDTVRRQLWAELRGRGDKKAALTMQRSRFALWKAPENLTEKQAKKLATIQSTNRPLYRAYLLKEQLRLIVRTQGDARPLIDGWLAWAARSRLPAFVELGRRIRRHRTALEATLNGGLSNALVESVNTRLRLVHRLAFGFHSAQAFISLAMLKLGGLCPPLPGRS